MRGSGAQLVEYALIVVMKAVVFFTVVFIIGSSLNIDKDLIKEFTSTRQADITEISNTDAPKVDMKQITEISSTDVPKVDMKQITDIINKTFRDVNKALKQHNTGNH